MEAADLFVKKLKQRGLTLALAESVTCGMAASMLANTEGTSEVLKGAIICYTPEIKNKLLRVPQKLIDKYTCESMQVTAALANNLVLVIQADISAALTGLAAAGGSETKKKPVGTVFFCMKYRNKIFKERELFKGTPRQIRKKACDHLFKMILKRVAP